jgi:ketosteroid isomerase-like protein
LTKSSRRQSRNDFNPQTVLRFADIVPAHKFEMDHIYAINVAKTEFREGFNTSDIVRILEVFSPGLVDFSDGQPSFYGEEAIAVMRSRLKRLFANYNVGVAIVIADIAIRGTTATDWGWHEWRLIPKAGGEVVSYRERYFECWEKGLDGKWRIAIYITNKDHPPEMPDFDLNDIIASAQASS